MSNPKKKTNEEIDREELERLGRKHRALRKQQRENSKRMRRQNDITNYARQLVLAATAGGAGFSDIPGMARGAFDAAEAMYAEQERRKLVAEGAAILDGTISADHPPEFADQPAA